MLLYRESLVFKEVCFRLLTRIGEAKMGSPYNFMTNRVCVTVWAGFIMFSLLAFPALADEVRLSNGDRLTGEIVTMEDEVLTLKTTYAGDIQVKREDVVCITSDGDLTFRLKNKEVLIGRATCPGDGRIQIVGVRIGESAELSLDELEAINPAPPPPAITYKANITAGGSMLTGNTDQAAAYFSGGFEARSNRHRFTVGAKYAYGETHGVVTARSGLGRIKYDLFITEKLYSYANGLFETDEFADLNLRSTFGLGLGYQISHTERTKLFIEGGLSYLDEDFDRDPDNKYFAARESLGLNYYIVAERVEFYHLHEFYYSLEESDNYYLWSEQGFRVRLVGDFFFNFEWDYSYNRQPAPGKKSADSAFIASLGYALNF